VRVYLGTTPRRAASLASDHLLPVTSWAVFAATPGLAALDPTGDQEEWEAFAADLAAESSLTLLAENREAVEPARRVVVAADLDEADVKAVDVEEAGRVSIQQVIRLDSVAALMVDDTEGETAVRQALEADDPTLVEDIPLSWFDPSELTALVAEWGLELE
jgi:hypothetical protein